LFNILDDLIAHNSSNKLTLDFSISIDDDGNSRHGELLYLFKNV